jgi:hypothetical protein
MEHPLKLVAVHTGNFFVIAAKRETGNAIAFVNFPTLMQITAGTVLEKNIIMDETFSWLVLLKAHMICLSILGYTVLVSMTLFC